MKRVFEVVARARITIATTTSSVSVNDRWVLITWKKTRIGRSEGQGEAMCIADDECFILSSGLSCSLCNIEKWLSARYLLHSVVYQPFAHHTKPRGRWINLLQREYTRRWYCNLYVMTWSCRSEFQNKRFFPLLESINDIGSKILHIVLSYAMSAVPIALLGKEPRIQISQDVLASCSDGNNFAFKLLLVPYQMCNYNNT